MLKFIHSNIYNPADFNILASDKKLLPFQFMIDGSDEEAIIAEFKLLNKNNEVQDLSADMNLIKKYIGNDFYFIFDGQTNLTTPLKLGDWQVYLKINTNFGTIDLYSNYFTIECEDKFIGKLEYWNSKDFNNEIFQTGYKKILYLNRQIISKNPYYKEIVTELSDGSKRYEYQVTADGYSTILYVNRDNITIFDNLKIYDNFKITFQEYSNTKLFTRPEMSISFEKQYYKIVVDFFINKIEKQLCINNKTINPADWILATGFWNDGGVWVDTATWVD